MLMLNVDLALYELDTFLCICVALWVCQATDHGIMLKVEGGTDEIHENGLAELHVTSEGNLSVV